MRNFGVVSPPIQIMILVRSIVSVKVSGSNFEPFYILKPTNKVEIDTVYSSDDVIYTEICIVRNCYAVRCESLRGIYTLTVSFGVVLEYQQCKSLSVAFVSEKFLFVFLRALYNL